MILKVLELLLKESLTTTTLFMASTIMTFWTRWNSKEIIRSNKVFTATDWIFPKIWLIENFYSLRPQLASQWLKVFDNVCRKLEIIRKILKLSFWLLSSFCIFNRFEIFIDFSKKIFIKSRLNFPTNITSLYYERQFPAFLKKIIIISLWIFNNVLDQ